MIQQILFITLETIFETVCFNYSLQHGYYVVSRIARAADKSTKK